MVPESLALERNREGRCALCGVALEGPGVDFSEHEGSPSVKACARCVAPMKKTERAVLIVGALLVLAALAAAILQ